MGADFRKLLIKAGGWVLLALGLLTFVLFAAGAGPLLERAFDLLLGRTYQFQSIGDVLRVHDPRYKVLSWDHSFLLLVGAFATGWIISWVNEFLERLEKSPEERRQFKAARKQGQEQIRNALVDRQRLEREQKAERKAAKRPMSGWRRLWIVLSLGFGAFAAILGWQPTRHDIVTVNRKVKTNQELWATPQMQSERSLCVPSTETAKYLWADDSTYTYEVDCDKNQDPVLVSLLWALAPAFFMALIGLTVRWIYRGFRPSKAKFAERSEQP